MASNSCKKNIVLQWKEYKDCYDKISTRDKYGRRIMLTSFSKCLTTKLQNECGVKCCLKSVWNYIKANDNIKPYWSGHYKCTLKQCSNSFMCVIQTKPIENQEVVVDIKLFGLAIHPLIKITMSLREQERIKVATNILATGLTNVYNQSLLEKECGNQQGVLC
jgi:hypothetical protein